MTDPRNSNPFETDSKEITNERDANRALVETFKPKKLRNTARDILQSEYDDAAVMVEYGNAKARDFWLSKAKCTAAVANELGLQLDEWLV